MEVGAEATVVVVAATVVVVGAAVLVVGAVVVVVAGGTVVVVVVVVVVVDVVVVDVVGTVAGASAIAIVMDWSDGILTVEYVHVLVLMTYIELVMYVPA